MSILRRTKRDGPSNDEGRSKSMRAVYHVCLTASSAPHFDSPGRQLELAWCVLGVQRAAAASSPLSRSERR